jgi:S1-C subfamily serine protease
MSKNKTIMETRPATCECVLLRLLSATALFLCLTFTSYSDELADKGRAIFKQNQHAVVTVQIVLKSKFSVGGRGGESNESRQDVTGTLVDPSGLTVLSLSATDPGQMLQSMLAGSGDEDTKFKMETELGDVKILLDDGTELPSEVVLRDRDLDLAFIRPKTKTASPLTSLDLSKSSKADILDQIIALNRLGNSAGRAYSASIERISAIVQRPRLFYVPDSSLSTTTLGAPAFTADGKVLGIFVMRAMKSKGGGGGFGMFNLQSENMTAIILPAEDVLKAAKQAPASAEEKESSKK